MKTCIECGEALVGRQTKFCSKKCNRTNWTKNNPLKTTEARRKWEINNRSTAKERHRRKHRAWKTRIGNKCIECGTTIDPRATRCTGCNSSENKHNWAGDNISYTGIHAWARRHKPKAHACENCKQNTPLELANLSGDYMRDIDDYKWLCQSCHRTMDNIYPNMIRHAKWKSDVEEILTKSGQILRSKLVAVLSTQWNISQSCTRYRLRTLGFSAREYKAKAAATTCYKKQNVMLPEDY